MFIFVVCKERMDSLKKENTSSELSVSFYHINKNKSLTRIIIIR